MTSLRATPTKLVYLAARFARRDELKRYAERLAKHGGFAVCSSWLDGEGDGDLESGGKPEAIEAQLQRNLSDIFDSHIFVAFTEQPSESISVGARGGRHVEFGFALCLREEYGLQVVVVGPRENLFYHSKEIVQFDDFESFLSSLVVI